MQWDLSGNLPTKKDLHTEAQFGFCHGRGCPRRDKCARYTTTEAQNVYASEPFNRRTEQCDYYVRRR